MRRFTAILLSFAFLLPACGGGSSDPVAVISGLLQAAGCTGDGVANYSAMFDAIEAELQKTPVPSTIDIDNGALIALGTVTTLAGDLDDGFDPGDRAEVDISSATFGGSVNGMGTVTVDFASATSIVLTGGFELDDGSCSVTFSNINIDFNPTDENDYGTGSVGFVTVRGEDILQGTITLNGGPTANVSASFNEGPATSFTIDLDTFQPSID